ncbi:vitelline membrane outer layer protein 1-like [Sinocyclocheilus rhinocerous]|uniref:vitelline membrane outer layer protein 1-like n=1 Tax=Sinocyclocheilus rhinocerous TaxID=307959 RepID=UPI0007B80867|nr:PREDICTED: vitelline membrane outer layer protein 1-like [Sinocyclocheilus rhinocerous]
MHHLISLLLVIIGLHVSIQTFIMDSDPDINRKNRWWLNVYYGTNWGSWGFKDICPNGTYAAGFSLKVEQLSYGFWDDNTALNGIRLHCVDPSKGFSSSYENYASVQSEVGSWGQWTEIKWCPSGFLTAFQLRVESSQGIEDDTAANNIRFRCSRGSLLEGDGTAWGEWGYMSRTCEGKAICGIMTQVEEPQGMRDDTALNDASMLCCD